MPARTAVLSLPTARSVRRPRLLLPGVATCGVSGFLEESDDFGVGPAFKLSGLLVSDASGHFNGVDPSLLCHTFFTAAP